MLYWADAQRASLRGKYRVHRCILQRAQPGSPLFLDHLPGCDPCHIFCNNCFYKILFLKTMTVIIIFPINCDAWMAHQESIFVHHAEYRVNSIS